MPSGNRLKELLLRLWLVMWMAVALLALSSCAEMHGPGTGPFNTVIVDAGHGGHDRGGGSIVGKPEKYKALDISLRLARELKRRGFRVVLTRDSDYFVTLGNRVAISNRTPGAIFVSIHTNWARRRGAQGLETFYYSPRSRRLAQNIQQEIMRVYPTANRGVKTARFYVLRNNRKPAVLVELGFLSNPYEAKLLESSRHRQRLAEAVARGIADEHRMN